MPLMMTTPGGTPNLSWLTGKTPNDPGGFAFGQRNDGSGLQTHLYLTYIPHIGER